MTLSLRIALSLGGVALLLTFACGHGIDSGTGKKIGQVIQLGSHGMVCTTMEGRLVRGGFNTGSGVAGGVFDFTVEDQGVLKQLNEAMEKQQEVEVAYRKVSLSGPCTSESDHFITAVKVLTETTPSVVVKPQADAKEAKRQELLQQLKELQ